MRTISLAMIALAVPVSTASAQVTGQTCTDLATTVAAGLTYSFTANELNAMRHYANCSSSQSSSASGLDITYGAFGLGAKYDEARKKAQCTQDEQKLGFSSTEIRQAKMVFDQGLATVNLCLDKAAKNWSIVARQISADSISIAVSNLHTSGGALAGIDIIPANSMQCLPMPTTFPLQLTSTNYLTMTCVREVKQTVVDNMTVSSTSDATLNLRLADGPFPIYLKGYTSSPLDGVKKDLTALRNDLIKIQKTLYEGSDVVIPGNSCPPGTYAVSLSTVSVGGGRAGFVESAQISCKALKFAAPQ